MVAGVLSNLIETEVKQLLIQVRGSIPALQGSASRCLLTDSAGLQSTPLR